MKGSETADRCSPAWQKQDLGTALGNARQGCVLATEAVGTRGKGGVLATEAVGTRGKGGVVATEAVGTRGKGGVLGIATEAVGT